MNRALRLVFIALVCVLPEFICGRSWAEHYDIFILAGQSNMDGRARKSDLKGDLASWAAPQQNVRIAYSCSNLRGPVYTSDGWKPLAPGYSVSPGKGKGKFELPSGTFGPEVSFGRTVADALPNQHIAIIKFAEGGTSLSKDWNPKVTGKLHDQMLDFTHKTLQSLTDKGDTYTIDAFVWHQGETDASLPAGQYQTDLTAFIGQIREDFGVKDLPFIIGEVYDNGKRDNVRAGELATSQNVPSAYFASSKELKTLDAGTHFNAASQIEMGKRMAEAFLEHKNVVP